MPRAQDVSVCLITKNEPYLKSALQFVRPWVQQIVVVVTGGVLSSEETALIDTLIEYDGIDPKLIDPSTGKPCFNFSLARDRSFAAARCKWLLWIDADDELFGLEHLEAELAFLEAQGQPLVQGMYPYEYAYDRHGSVTMLLSRERIMLRAGGWGWAEPIHESILPIGHRHHREKIVWKHHKDFSKLQESWARNLGILRAIVATQPNARNVYYLGMACADGCLREEAIAHLSRFVTMTDYEEELHNAYRILASMHLDLGRVEEAIPFAWKTVELRENWLESWFILARCYYLRAERTKNRRDWQRCVYFGEHALKQPPTTSWHPVLPMVRTHEIYWWMSRAYDQLWDTKAALRMAEEGLKAVPDDGGMLYNRLLLQTAIDKGVLEDTARRLLGSRGQREVVGDGAAIIDSKIEEAFTSLARMTEGIFQRVSIGDPVSKTSDVSRKLHAVPSKLDIVFACGDGWVPWDPESIAKEGFGGGSEVAVVEMARRLVARGHRVRVYNPCPRPGDHDGVEYVHWQTMMLPRTAQQPNGIQCDVLIEWRTIAWASKFDAHLKLLWLHDVVAWSANPTVPATKAEIEAACHFVLCVSEWHRQNLHKEQGVPLDRILKTRNGIAKPERFKMAGIGVCPECNGSGFGGNCTRCLGGGLEARGPSLKRDPHKVIWNMSPDRGLEVLLGMWPDIRKAVPDASLHIFYGLETWKKMGHNPDAIVRLEGLFEALREQGVVYRGRVPPDVLAREMLTAGCWFYPNWVFPEVSCVAAMEAQAAGLHVVSSTHAALEETVRWGARTSDVTPFIRVAVDALKRQDMWHEYDPVPRAEQSKLALEAFSLDTLTDEWVVLFKEKLQEKVAAVELPPYEGVLP